MSPAGRSERPGSTGRHRTALRRRPGRVHRAAQGIGGRGQEARRPRRGPGHRRGAAADDGGVGGQRPRPRRRDRHEQARRDRRAPPGRARGDGRREDPRTVWRRNANWSTNWCEPDSPPRTVSHPSAALRDDVVGTLQAAVADPDVEPGSGGWTRPKGGRASASSVPSPRWVPLQRQGQGSPRPALPTPPPGPDGRRGDAARSASHRRDATSDRRTGDGRGGRGARRSVGGLATARGGTRRFSRR